MPQRRDIYQYDSVGNRTQRVHTVGSNVTTISDTYDSNGDDRLMTETATGVNVYSTSYSYDNNGSLISEVRTGTGVTTSNYTYDVQNHLVAAIVGGTTTNYSYDANGNRVSSTQGSTTTYYTTDDNNPTGYTQILEQATSFGGTPTTTYVSGLAVLGQANSSGVLSYLVSDGHGSTRILADASGGITSRYDYDAYGNALTSTSGTQILYAGQFLDSATGLYNLRARNYDPTTGRFIGTDPIAYGAIDQTISLDRYLYAGDNPIGNFDPTGQQLLGLLGSIGIDDILEGISSGFALRATTGAVANLAANIVIAEINNQQYTVGQGIYDFFSGGLIAGISGGLANTLTDGLAEVGYGKIFTLLASQFGGAIVNSFSATASYFAKTEAFEGHAPTTKQLLQTAGFSLIGSFLGSTAGKALQNELPAVMEDAAEHASEAFDEFTERASLPGNEGLQAASNALQQAAPYIDDITNYILSNEQAVATAVGTGANTIIGGFFKIVKATVFAQ
jgi:RHS repeat-associated protein